MEKILVISALFNFTVCFAQTVPVQKDTLKLDSTQIKKIQKMPMDSIPHSKPKLDKDTLNYKRTIDDADPKKPKSLLYQLNPL